MPDEADADIAACTGETCSQTQTACLHSIAECMSTIEPGAEPASSTEVYKHATVLYRVNGLSIQVRAAYLFSCNCGYAENSSYHIREMCLQA